ncbi:hypothetical protein RND71_042552 [Anisodus tanguticus]|uniref:Ubiquitin-like domain-containing protein n=1 Tax=Anisodus tanguticus TaxID=243964 RepID=A0AAE1UUS0_9SOLA|nr:hypothetical protein RND71_042552 [Anisodus tanguticus]
MAGESRIMRIKVESPTSQFYAELREKDEVRNLMKIIKWAWGDDYMTLHHNFMKLEIDQSLSAYNIRHGSIVKVNVFAEPLDDPEC